MIARTKAREKLECNCLKKRGRMAAAILTTHDVSCMTTAVDEWCPTAPHCIRSDDDKRDERKASASIQSSHNSHLSFSFPEITRIARVSSTSTAGSWTTYCIRKTSICATLIACILFGNCELPPHRRHRMCSIHHLHGSIFGLLPRSYLSSYSG